MKILYAARVLFVSFEMVILLISCLVLVVFQSNADAAAAALRVNEELTKFLILLPLALVGWIVKEAKDLIFADPEHAKVLVNWPDYWKLKLHIFACFFFGSVFLVLSAIPWLSAGGISNGKGLVFFIAGIVGTIWVAASLYQAQISVKEIFHTER